MNSEFLQSLFGDKAPRVHVASHPFDPDDIPNDQHARAWAGGPIHQQSLRDGENQYFTISLFHGTRRRKADFDATYVIVLDDVREKLDQRQANRLPPPTYVLETSPGSEQWGYKLTEPCADRRRVENLQDGLVASDLAPSGRDPGMKGVTRYVRLPDGHNLKQSKSFFGTPWKCQLITWKPDRTTTLEALAEPFGIDLDAARREQRVDGAADIPDHPLLAAVTIKEQRGPGRYDITCPWVHEHTGEADNGAAVFTNADGSIGFQCHHGACQERTARDLLAEIETHQPGFRTSLKRWQMEQSLPDTPQALDDLRRLPPGGVEFQSALATALEQADALPALEQAVLHDEIRDLAGWTQSKLDKTLRAMRKERATTDTTFYQSYLFVTEMNKFYNMKSGAFLSPDAFINAHSEQDPEVRKNSLEKGRVAKVERVDYAPGLPAIFDEDGITYANLYQGGDLLHGEPGDCTPWLDHWQAMGWGDDIREHMLKFMAYTILHPEKKINHMMLLGSPEGSGKDFLLYPLIKAMGRHGQTIAGDDLIGDYNEYLYRTKYLHINEVEVGDRREAKKVSVKIKPMAAAPPDRINLNIKYLNTVQVRNIVNATMCTNSTLPLRIGDSRRFFAAWSHLRVRNERNETKPEWVDYWTRLWPWMHANYKACIHYLRTQVDLSTFNPEAAPPSTEFLRNVQELSKPPVQATLEAFRAKRVGAFDKGVATSRDLLSTLQTPFASDLMQTSIKAFSTGNIERALREMGVPCREAGRLRLWVFDAKFQSMSDEGLLTIYKKDVAQRTPS